MFDPIESHEQAAWDREHPIIGGFRLYARSWRVLSPLVAVMVVLNWVGTRRTMADQADPTAIDLGAMFFDLSLAMGASLLLMIPYAAMLVVLGYRALEVPIGLTGALRGMRQRFVQYIAAWILTLLALIPIAVVMGVVLGGVMMMALAPFMPGQFDPNETRLVVPQVSLALLAVALVAALLLTPVYIHVATRLSFASMAAMLGNLGGVDAVRHSWHLTKGRTLQIFGVMMLVVFPVALMAGWVIGVSVFSAEAGQAPALWPERAAWAVMTIYSPAISAALVLLWYRLRARRGDGAVEDFRAELPVLESSS
jgi:hypothetical protein